ncbi:MAG: sigma-70 family RNA polymerase sigma factor [Candidatus Moranbacteria bacterium]|nr:sigma-70 family RNA polymerase sigma factor [Candidatus Moranbacteria bacterium]
MKHQIPQDSLESSTLQEIASNPEVFGKVIERYHPELKRFIQRISFFQSEDVEDILQDSYIKAYKNIHRYDISMKFSTWLYHIVRNTTIDEIRRVSRRPKLYSLEEEDIARIFKSEHASDTEVLRNEDVQLLKEALSSLPEKYREVLTLRYLEEKSYEEIMDIIEIPKGTVAARINRAKTMLAQKLPDTNLFHT